MHRSKKAAVSDGFPSSTIGEGTSRSSISNPTATAAERHAGGKDARDRYGEKVLNRNGDPIGLPDSWREQPDPVRDTIRELDALLHNIRRTARRRDPEWLAEIARWARSLDRKRQYVTSSPKLTGRPSSGQCKGCGRAVTGSDDDKLRAGFCPSCSGSCRACERTVAGTQDDRLRSGYCSACYSAWGRAGYPDRFEFERSRQPYEAEIRT